MLQECIEKYMGKVTGMQTKIIRRDGDGKRLATAMVLRDNLSLILYREMTDEELMVVAAHEIAHILNRQRKHNGEHNRIMIEVLADMAREFDVDLMRLLVIKKKLDSEAGVVYDK